MMKIDIEKGPVRVEDDAHETDKKSRIKDKAEEARIEAHDEVKAMNSMVNKAKCYKVLDKQKEEKVRLIMEEQKEEERMALEMEIERLKDLKVKEQKKVEQQNKQLEQKNVIMRQIRDNEQARLKAAEARNREAQQMVRHAEALCREEKEAEEKKHQQAHKLILEMNKANDASKESKELMVQREKLEDDKVVE